MARSHRQLQFCVCVYLTSLLASSAKIPAIIVFGDSTVDAGNNNGINTLLKSNFPPYGRDFGGGRPTGRFCNGRLATDFISEAVGLTPTVPAYLDPDYGIEDFATGVCFASAGTGLDNATSDVLSVIPLWKEVEYFKEYQSRLSSHLGREKAKTTLDEALYVISIGTNDFVENYFLFITGRIKQFSVGEYEDFLVGRAADFVTDIYRLGARKIAFAGLPPIGCLPLERTANNGACNEEYNKAARDYNAKLQAMVGKLCVDLPGLKLRYADLYQFAMRPINSPSSYGYENVHQGCCGTGEIELGYLCDSWNPFTCPDADKYLFWDAFHPTERVNREVAETLLNTTLVEFI